MVTAGRGFALAILVAGSAIVSGCQQERNTTAPVSSVRDVPPATAAAATTAQPVKVPAGDPSLPPADVANRPAREDSNTAIKSDRDGAHTALTQAERDKALPLEGQVNNYSSDAFAKRGNDDVARGSPQAARGSEAIATPNSYPKDTK